MYPMRQEDYSPHCLPVIRSKENLLNIDPLNANILLGYFFCMVYSRTNLLSNVTVNWCFTTRIHCKSAIGRNMGPAQINSNGKKQARE